MKVIEQKTLWEGRFIKAVLLTYRDRRGHLRTWEAVDRVGCRGIVIVVPVTSGGEILLIRQYRAVLDGYAIELPAGLVGTDEDPRDAARRELIEETGHFSDAFSHVTRGGVSTGINMETFDVLLARDARPAPDELRRQHPPDECEDIQLIKTPLENIDETLDRLRRGGDMVDLRLPGVIGLARRLL